MIELEGEPEAVHRVLGRLRTEAPPLAMVERVIPRTIEPTGSRAFEIRSSRVGADSDTLIAPDTAVCADCLAELFDPGDRRYRYPLINCTNCGPRLTIVDGVPYDRARTTMARFVMCEQCEREYRDPANRRFHAQPNACPACGPRVRLVDAGGRDLSVPPGRDPLAGAASLLAGGAILAVKGLGGYHLAADATDQRAVVTLRERKHRERRPLALMVADTAVADSLAAFGPEELALLSSPARPVVLAPRRPEARVAPSIAPAVPELGVLLSYTPLHHLLLADFAATTGRPAVLVMTSGNVSREPIVHDDGDALVRLGPIADAFLTHDRPIRTPVDDSVLRVVCQRADDAAGTRSTRPQMLRRSRGYVPAPLPLPVAARRPLLACGAELKSTFCLARGRHAWPSHHIGDLEEYGTLIAYRRGIDHFERLLELEPQLLAHDLHPRYASTAYAGERTGVELVAVQHHHAHLAACLAEHGHAPGERAVGAIYDGTGYGTDGTVWGGEVLVGGLVGYERVATLAAVPLPGGEAAIREPWRMACSWLHQTFGAEVPVPRALIGSVAERRWRAVAAVATDRSLSPLTTSMGRLFDAVAALCGIAPVASYEGQAAVELSATAVGRSPRPYELPVCAKADGGPRLVLDPVPLIAAIAADLAGGREQGEIAAGFERAVATATANVCALAAADAGLDTVVLSGGVFQNRALLEDTSSALAGNGLRVLTPSRLPCNDGGISYGQAAVAACLDACRGLRPSPDGSGAAEGIEY